MRLAEPSGHVEDDERARRGERPLPGGVGDEKAAHLGLLPQDAPAALEVRRDALEHAAVPAVLAHEHDRGAAGSGRDEGCEQKWSRVPDLEQPAAPHERGAEGDSAQHVLHALRAAVGRLRQQVRIQAAIRRLIDVVREEECEDDQRRRPEIRHERHQEKAEPDRPECGQHERTSPTKRCVERVAPRADHGREHECEHALGPEDESDQRTRGRELMEKRRQVGSRRRDGERQAEGTQPEGPEEAAPGLLRARRGNGSYLRH